MPTAAQVVFYVQDVAAARNSSLQRMRILYRQLRSPLRRDWTLRGQEQHAVLRRAAAQRRNRSGGNVRGMCSACNHLEQQGGSVGKLELVFHHRRVSLLFVLGAIVPSNGDRLLWRDVRW